MFFLLLHYIKDQGDDMKERLSENELWDRLYARLDRLGYGGTSPIDGTRNYRFQYDSYYRFIWICSDISHFPCARLSGHDGIITGCRELAFCRRTFMPFDDFPWSEIPVSIQRQQRPRYGGVENEKVHAGKVGYPNIIEGRAWGDTLEEAINEMGMLVELLNCGYELANPHDWLMCERNREVHELDSVREWYCLLT